MVGFVLNISVFAKIHFYAIVSLDRKERQERENEATHGLGRRRDGDK